MCLLRLNRQGGREGVSSVFTGPSGSPVDFAPDLLLLFFFFFFDMTVAGSAVCSAAEETAVVSELVPVGKLSTLDGVGLGTGDGIECIWGCKERSKVVAKFLYVDERYRQVAIFERC